MTKKEIEAIINLLLVEGISSIPREHLTEEVLTHPSKTIGNQTILHFAATKGFLNKLPSNFLVGKYLKIPIAATGRGFGYPPLSVRVGWTALHSLAWNGTLHHVSSKELTTENITIADSGKWTPLHCAAWRGHLNQLPRASITTEALLIPDTSGLTPLRHAIECRHTDQLLGIEAGDEILPLLGEDWHKRNLEVLHEIKQAEMEHYSLPQIAQTIDIEI